jgi:HlyD family secretion protein
LLLDKILYFVYNLAKEALWPYIQKDLCALSLIKTRGYPLKTAGKLLRWLLMLGGVLLLIGACGFFVVVRPQMAQRQAQTQNAPAAFIAQRNLDDVLVVAGTVRPAQVINLSFEVAGKVATVAVKAGAVVKAGDTLASLDSADLQRALTQAELALKIQQANYDSINKPATAEQTARARATLAQANAALESAKAQFDNQRNAITSSCANLAALEQGLARAQDTYNTYITEGYQFDIDFRPDQDSPVGRAWKTARDQRDVASANCDSVRRTQSGNAAVLSAEAQVAQANAALESLLAGATPEQLAIADSQLAQAKLNLQAAQENLASAELKAPVDGLISAVNIAVGQMVGAAAQPAFVLADTSSVYLETQVDENDIPRVALNLPVRFTLQGLPDLDPFAGVVESKNLVGQSTQGVVAYAVRIAFTSKTVPTYLGMSADVEIIIATSENVLVLPARAVRRNEDGSRFIVVERSDATTVNIPVEVGLNADDLVEISGEGLREGQKVLLPSR